jgi:hypothetical protein
MSERVMTESMECAAAGTHDHERGSGVPCTNCGEYDPPTNAWKCDVCGVICERYRGIGDVECVCGANYNASGQRLRDDWRGNPSTWDEDVSDLDGFEYQHAGDW